MSIEILTKWRDTLEVADKAIDPAYEILGADSKLLRAFGAIEEEYTRLVADMIGADAEMLLDFWLAHDFGAKPIRSGIGEESLRIIASVGDLWEFIECLKKSSAS